MIIEASPVSKTTIQDASVLESCVQRKFAPAPIWTEAMLAALQIGVKGGKWHSLIGKQKHRPGQGRCLHDHKQWPNAFFAGLGLFTMSKAHKLARQSR